MEGKETWKRIELTWHEITSGKKLELMEAFSVHLHRAGSPPDAVMYGVLSIKGPRYVYFTPKAAEISASLMAAFGAVDCDPPNTDELALLVWNAGSRSGN